MNATKARQLLKDSNGENLEYAYLSALQAAAYALLKIGDEIERANDTTEGVAEYLEIKELREED